MAVLVEEAEWETVFDRMREHNFQGEIIVKELIAEHLDAVEKLLEQPPAEAVPEEMKVEAPAEVIIPRPEAAAPEEPEKSS